jgi:hypothetical protein
MNRFAYLIINNLQFMKKLVLFFTFYFLLFTFIDAQDSTKTQNIEDLKPVREPWACNMLIESQTTLVVDKGIKEFIIHHRFTGFANGIKDLYGFYGASNIRLGLNYGLSKRISIGFGTEKDKKYQEFSVKAKLFDQNRGGSIPVSMTFYGNTCINGRDKEYFATDYKFIDRLSFFGQFIMSRKFSDAISLMAAASWSHINKVESIEYPVPNEFRKLYKNDALGITAGGRYKFYNDYSFIAEYNQGFYLGTIKYEQIEPQPVFALGFEKNTSTHTFQLVLTNYRGIIPQQNFIMNQTDYHLLKDFALGFNITVRI